MSIIKPKIIQQIFTLLLVILIGVLIFREMIPYFSGVLGAITIYVLLRNIMAKLVHKGWRPELVAAFLMFLSFITILVPVTGAILMLSNEVQEMVLANALGIPLVAIAQGIVALIGFLIFGIESPFFLEVVVTIGSMIPFIGNFLETIPVFILTLSNGDTAQAWGILMYGIVIVGTTDNIIRLYVLRRLDNVHPLITLIGVVIGIPLFGFIGLIFWALLISLFIMIVRIYRKEYAQKVNLDL